MKLKFFKYQGTGNDFIIVDNRNGEYPSPTEKEVARLCNRKFGIGADGLMLLNTADGFDFEMKYYNSDGKPGSMCGNGGRCIVKFAASQKILKNTYHFLAADGMHEAEIDADGIVRLKMADVDNIDVHASYFLVNTGSPHFIKYVEDVRHYDVVNEGRDIRNSPKFKQEGINVNFVEHLDDDRIFVRTYERGVEDETESCGTGVTASALLSAHNDNGFNLVEVQTPGGLLTVEFDKIDDNHFSNIWLCGPAEQAFSGEIEIN
jgi:diaminopimelate epimerase